MDGYYSIKKYIRIFTLDEVQRYFPEVDTTEVSPNHSYLIIFEDRTFDGVKEVIGPFPSVISDAVLQEYKEYFNESVQRKTKESLYKRYHLHYFSTDDI